MDEEIWEAVGVIAGEMAEEAVAVEEAAVEAVEEVEMEDRSKA